MTLLCHRLRDYEGRTNVKKKSVFMIVMSMLIFVAGKVPGQDLIVYPAKGQSKDQQSKDEYACHQWAVQQTGFDPSKQQWRLGGALSVRLESRSHLRSKRSGDWALLPGDHVP
jgi:hypothetical protein